MLISAREAAEVLEPIGLGRRHADRVLASGLAGEPVRTRSAVLYEAERVRDLAGRRTVGYRELMDRCRAGFFVARRDVDVRLTREEQLARLRGGWGEVSPWAWLGVRLQIERQGSLPFLATVSGFVVLGADIIGLHSQSELVLGPAGGWYDEVAGCRFPTGPGRPWVLHLGPLSPAKIAA